MANNHTLYAKWTGGSINLKNTNRSGYILEGWYKEADCINKVGNAGVSFTPTVDITLYAKWEKEKDTTPPRVSATASAKKIDVNCTGTTITCPWWDYLSWINSKNMSRWKR